MVTAVLSLWLFCASPVPKPPPPPPDPIVPGYRWVFAGYLLEVVSTDGEKVRYRCVNRPQKVYGGCDGYAGGNEQNRARVRDEESRFRFTEILPWEPDI